jgi:hypothetical protein
MLSLPTGLGPTGASATGVEEHPTNNETKPVPITVQTLFIILYSFHLGRGKGRFDVTETTAFPHLSAYSKLAPRTLISDETNINSCS